jgi:hypothetical protein
MLLLNNYEFDVQLSGLSTDMSAQYNVVLIHVI